MKVMKNILRTVFAFLFFSVLFISPSAFAQFAQCPTNATVTGFTNVTCNGLNNGTITVKVNDGTTPFIFRLYDYDNDYLYLTYPSADVITGGVITRVVTGSTVTFSGVSPGSYKVVIDRNTVGGPCTQLQAPTGLSYVIITQPVAFTASVVSTTPACSGGSTGSIDISVSGGNSPYTYAWTGGLPAQQDHSGTVAAGSYDVTVTDSKGCTATLTGITVAPRPSAVLSGDATICVGSSTNLTFTLAGSSPWKIVYLNGATPVTVSGITTSPFTVSVTPASTTTYTLQSVQDNICAGTGAVSGSATVQVNAYPNATITAAGPFCINSSSVNLKAATAGGTWSGTGITDATLGTFDPSLAGAGTSTITYSVTVGGCTSTDTENIVVNPLPVATFAYAGPYCVNGAANPSPTFSGGGVAGTFTSTAGLSINSTTGLITLASSTAGTYTVTNTIAAAGGCQAVSATATVTINPTPIATFAYAGPYCVNGSTDPSPTFSGGGIAGTFTAPAGLSVDANTGKITLSSSTAGTYTVTNTVTTNGCINSATATVTINPTPVATFAYAGPYCVNGATNPLPTFSGGGVAGTFTSTAGLAINASSGLITLASSTAGTYTVTNTIVAAGGCQAVSATATVTVNPTPIATFAYAGPYCVNGSTDPSPTFSGGGIAGTFTAPAGLSINAATGLITLSTSTAGTYTVTNTVTTNGCIATATASVTINATPVATFAYAGPYCVNGAANPSPTFSGGGVAGTFSSTAGLSINASTGLITLSTSTAGTYTVTNTIAAAGNCQAVVATATVIINATPIATFAYAGPYCVNGAANPSPTFSGGGIAGTFTAPAGLSINAATGLITLSTSTAGTYTVTNTVTTNGCIATATASVTINATPVATFAYAGPYCVNGAANPSPTFSGGGVAGTFSSTAGLSINASTGLITLSTSTAGTYTVTNTIAAAGNCQAVVATATVIINPTPVATFAYAGPYCVNGAANPSPTFSGGGIAGTFTAPAGLSINAATGLITLSTSTIGTYTVTNTVTANGCVTSATASVTINATPVATFAYAGPYCVNGATNPSPTFSGGGVAGTFSSSAGLSINASTGLITLSTSTAGTYTVTNTVISSGCTTTATASVTITTAPVATFAYAGPYCVNGAANPSPTFSGGGVSGTFSSTAGLSVNATTGLITLASSTPGTYTVTNTIAAAGNCQAVTATASVTINATPVATFAYAGPYCVNGVANPSPTFSGGGVAGAFSSTVGLSINATTGLITLSTSTAGTYTVTNTVTTNGCVTSATASVTINTTPVATFAYAGPYCVNGATDPSPTFSGGVAGTFSSTAGLSINATTGLITLASSTPGTYTVTNTIAAAGSCQAVSATASVTINAAPVATFAYAGPYCVNGAANPTPTFSGGGVAGTFSSSAGLSINATTGLITLSTSTAGTYTITNTIAASGSCQAVTATASVTITTAPVATFAYSGPYCVNGATNPSPTFSGGGVAGTFSSTAGLSIDATTGLITLTTSAAGIYTVTNTIAAAGNCQAVTATASVTITTAPVATFAYAGPYCVNGATNPTPTFSGGGVAGTFSSTAGLSINASTGLITLSSSTAGTYTVTNTVTTNGCTTSAITSVTITPAPVAGISYTGTPFCASDADPLPTFTSGSQTGGVFSASSAQLIIDATTGKVDLANSTAGNYTISYTVTANGCTTVATASLRIKASPHANFSYTATPYCQGDADPSPTYSQSGSAGTFTSSPAGLVISATTGKITLATSTPGTYTVTNTVTGNGNGGCDAIANATVTIKAAPTTPVITASGPTTFCAGGSVVLTSSSATGNVWSTGETTQSITVSTAGSYIVTVTANGCSATSVATNVTVTPQPSAPTVTSPITYCQGATASALTATGTNLLWYTAATGGSGVATVTPATSVIGSTDYFVSQTVGTCESPRTKLTVTITTAPVLAITDPAAVCSPATVDLTAAAVTAGSTGAGTLSYYSTMADATAGINPLASSSAVSVSGTYFIKSATAGCSDIKSVKVTINSISLSATTVNTSVCSAASGSIDLTVTGTNSPYTYAWSDGGSFTATNEDISGLAAGTYTVIVTDAGGCTATLSKTIGTTTPLVLSAIAGNSTNCIAANGSITLTINGGLSPYTFVWSNGVKTQNLTGLSAGIYSVTVTDAAGCTATASQTITDPAGITLSMTALNVTDCAAPDGALAVSVSGGKAPYTYLWNTNETTQSLSGLTAGTYSVLVTDNNGCSATLSKTITDPAGIVLSTTAINSTNCAAPNGSVSVTITSGGVAPFTYLWSNNATTASISNLTAGTYSVTVTDANDCKSTISGIVADPAAIVLNAGTTNSTSCATPDGKIDLSIISGGVAPFTYTWSNGANTEDLANLKAGIYTVIVKDANGCQATLTRAIADPAGIGLSAISTDVTNCTTANGSITLTVTGSVGTLTYAWSNGAGFTSALQNLSNLSAGTYTVVVKDANGCQATLSKTITSPAALVLTAVVTDGSGCTGGNGAIDLTVAGGKIPYTYNWNTGAFATQDLTNLIAGNYTVVVTDANGCTATLSKTITAPVAMTVVANTTNATDCKVPDGKITLAITGGTAPFTYLWSNNTTLDNLSGLAAGTYSVTVTDASGCSVLVSGTITDPANILLTATIINSTDCASPNGSIKITKITGGLAPYTYLWSNGITVDNISALASGSYSVTVTDANGCTATLSSVVTDPCTPACNLVATATATNSTSCTTPDGKINLTVSGGTAPFTYSWSNNAAVEDLTGLTAGIYTVIVRDSKGCTATVSVTVADPAAIALTTVITNVTNCKTPNGAINLTIARGTAPYAISWNNAATTEDLTALSAGTYVVTVVDSKGCTATLSVIVKDPAGMLIAVSASNSTNCTTPDGSISVTVTGGLAPYTYLWATGQITKTLSALSAGTYSVTVTDANGCTATLSTVITDPSGMSLTAVSANSSDCTTPNGTITLSVSSGVAPYTFAWSNGAGFTSALQNLTGLAAGTYTVIVTDANNCKATLTRTISDPGAITLSAVSANSTSCTTPDGSISLTATGTGLTFAWSNGAGFTSTAEDLTGLAAGTYTVVVKNANGCQATLTKTITGPAAPSAPTVTSPVAYCQGASATALTATGSAGGILQWYTVATAGTASTTAPTPITSAVGTVNYFVSQIVNGCESARTLIAVNVTATSPAPTATNPAALCSGSAIPTLTATGTSLKWYKDAALTTQLGSGANFTPASADLNMTAAGTTTFFVTQNIGCGESVATTVSVTVKAASDPTCQVVPCTLTADAGTDQLNVCPLNTNLAATALTGAATGIWSKVSGAGNVTFGTAASATSSITVDQAGTYVLRWLVTEGTCTASDDVTITFNTVSPAPTAVSPAALCVGSAIPTLTATGTSLKWYKDAALTTQVGTGASFTPASADLDMAVAKTTTFYVTQTTACGESAATAVTVTVTATSPVPTASSPIAVCQNGAIPTLSATGTSLKWYSNAALTTQVGNGASFTPNTSQLDMTVAGNTTFFVTQNIGCGESVATQVVVTVSPTSPAPTAVSPAALCSGSAIPTLTATGTALKWYKDAALTTQLGSGASFTPASADLNMTAAATTTFFVTQNIGCGESVATTVSVTVKAANDPTCQVVPCTLTANAGTDQPNVCPLNTNLAATALTGAATGIWSKVSGAGNVTFGTASSATSSVTVDQAGTYVLRWFVTEGTCTASDSVTITFNTVSPAPTAVSPAALCVGSAIPTLAATGTSLKWYKDAALTKQLGTGVSFTPAAADLNMAVAGTTTFFVTQTTACGESATTAVNVTVSGSLTASVQITATATTVCANTAITFTAAPTNGGSAPTYQWKVNGKDVSGANAATFTSSALTNNAQVTVIMTAAGSSIGCITGSPATSNQIGITITNTLTPSVSITASQTSACPGTAITFTAAATNGGTAPTYQWQVDGKDVNGEKAASFTSSALLDKEKVTVVMKPDISGAGSCINPAAVASNAVTMTISNSLPASVSITASATTICTGTAVTFTASPTNGGSTPTYQWLVNGLNVSGTGATFTSSTLANNDKVSVVMTAAGSGVSCIVNSPAVSNQIAITISNSLAASVSITASQISACPNTAITFTASATNGGSAPTYKWQINGSPVSGEISATFTSSVLKNNDLVTVVMTAGGTGTGCITGSPATSNAVTMTISNNLIPSVSIAAGASGPFCAGSSITFTATATNGGTAPAYVWKVNGTAVGATGATFASSTLNNSDVVTVSLTPDVSGAGSCIDKAAVSSNAVTVTVKPANDPTCNCSLALNISSNPVTCQGDTNGEAIALVFPSGSGQYLYSLNGGTPVVWDQIFKVFTSQPFGPFTITVTDRNNTLCTTTGNGNIGALVTLVAQVNSTDPTCAGNDGKIVFDAFKTGNGGGKSPYNISIDGGKTFTQTATGAITFNNLAAGTYNIVISDGTPCTTTLKVTLKNQSQVSPSVVISTPSATVCAGAAVTFTAKATNGGNNPAYQWKVNGLVVGNNPTFTSSTLTSTDVVTVTMKPDLSGAGSCINPLDVNSNALSVTPSSGLTPSVTITTPNVAVCTGAAITFTANPTNGGTAPKYQWKLNGSLDVGTNSATFSTTTLTSTDVVTVVMTPDVSGTGSCITAGAVASNGLSVTVSSTSLTASVSISTPSTEVCVNTLVTFTAKPTNGGVAPVYQWKVNSKDVGTNSATFTSSVLTSSDVITVVMTPDVSGAGSCIVAGPVTSNNLSVKVSTSITPTVSIAPSAPSICVGGSVTFTATVANGGTTPTFQWKLNGNNVGNGTATYTNSTLASTDVVTVVVKPDPSGNGSCIVPTAITSNASSVTVKPANDPSCSCNLVVVPSHTSVICAGDQNGTALALIASGGSGNGYLYSLNGATPVSSLSDFFVQFPNQPAGKFTITVTDLGTNCTTTVKDSIGTLVTLITPVFPKDPSCNGSDGKLHFGAITTGNNSGKAPFKISIDGGATFFNSQTGDTTFNNLSAGTYKVVIKDGTTCTTQFNVVLTGGASIIANLTKNDVTCNGASNGVVTITNPSGGANNGYVYSKDGTNFSGTSSFTGLSAGSYTFYVKDANSVGTCLLTFPVTVTQPAKLLATATPTQPASCQSADGKIVAAVTSGGLAPFEYKLNTGAFQTDPAFSALANGDYTLTVRDANACEVALQVKLTSAGAITATPKVISEATCNGKADGKAQLTLVTGGSGTYEYSIDGVKFQDGPLFDKLPSGDYLLTVRDKGVTNGCNASFSVKIAEPIQITAVVTPSKIPTDCKSKDGEITVSSASGGNSTFLYSLDSLVGYQTSPVFTALGNGSYKVFVKDSKGCIASYALSLVAPGAIQVGKAVSVVSLSCNGAKFGIIDLNPTGTNVTGGQAPYLYSLNGGAYVASSLFDSLAAGTYQAKVKDQAGCELGFAYTLTEPAGIAFSINQSVSAGCSGGAGIVKITIADSAKYEYSLDNIEYQVSTQFDNLGAGNHTMYVRERLPQPSPCVTSKAFVVSGSTAVTFDVSQVDIGCGGVNTGKIMLTNIAGGKPATGVTKYKVSINGGKTYFDVTGNSFEKDGLTPGDYQVILSYGENLGCFSEVRTVKLLSSGVYFSVKTTAATCGENNGAAEVVVLNPSPTYLYSLEPNTGFQAAPMFTDLGPGTYTMYIRTGAVETCPNQMAFTVPGPAKLTYKFKKNDSCEGDDNSGSIVISGIAGGSVPYKVSVDNGANFTHDIFQTNFSVTGLKPGDYQIVVADKAGCKTLPVPVRINESRMRARTRVEPSLPDEPNGSVLVTDIRGGSPTYEVSIDGLTWGPVRSSKLDTLITGIAVGSYTLFIRDDNGCIKEFPFKIAEALFTIPNIFTPNGDTYNDTFRIRNLPDGSKLTVVNRWGRTVYENSNYQNDWDGGTLPDGIYFYNINVPVKGNFSGWVEVRRGVE
jgi:gliding motility-associated-like protein